MAGLIHQRCFHHAEREAAARCPRCGRFFCRECVTEHASRVTRAACLKDLFRAKSHTAGVLRALTHSLLAAVGVLVAWMFFHYLGRTLLLRLDDLHGGGG